MESPSDQAPPDKKKPKTLRVPTSLAARSFQFLKMGASLAAKAGVVKDSSTKRLEQAEVLVQGLSKLKGAAMKLGQTASVELRDLLPVEVVEALSRLQDQGLALSGNQIREILIQEWGSERFSQLESFIETPLASASIGQVHAARWKNQEIVLKVQFPGIHATVDSDVQGLGILLRSVLALTGRKVSIEPFLEELATVFRQETDYRLEASFIEEYREKLAPFSVFRVPQVVKELSTTCVLGMSRERGLKPLDWIQVRRPSLEVRNFIGQSFLDLYEIEFFQLGLVQTDPNFANFLIDDFQDRQNPTVVLLDFGAVKRYEPAFRSSYRQLLRLSHEGSDAELLEKSLEIGLLDRAEVEAGRRALIDLLRASVSPLADGQQPFRFTDADYSREMRERAFKLTQSCRVSPPPRAILFLHRKLGGIFNLLKAMEVELDLKSYWQRIVLKDDKL